VFHSRVPWRRSYAVQLGQHEGAAWFRESLARSCISACEYSIRIWLTIGKWGFGARGVARVNISVPIGV